MNFMKLLFLTVVLITTLSCTNKNQLSGALSSGLGSGNGSSSVPVQNPTPTPVSTPVQSPTPIPTPTPVQNPTPNPTPVSTPIPTPKPTPGPTPVSTPVSTPTPEPTSTPVSGPTATITWGTTYQTMDGFGASTGTGSGSNLLNHGPFQITNSEANIIWNSSGASLSLLRIFIWPDGTYPDNPAIKTILSQGTGVRVWGTLWSPPAQYKTGDHSPAGIFTCNGPDSTQYGNFANYIVNWVQHQNNSGIPIYGVSLQNEPDYCTGSTAHQPFSLWSAQNFHDFILVLGPAMANAGLGSVKIILPETSDMDSMPKLADTCLNDPNCAKYVSIAATHIYSGTITPYVNAQNKGLHLWETEIATFGNWDGSMNDGLNWAKNIHNFMMANASAWHWWQAEATFVQWCDNETLLSGPTCSGGPDQTAKRLWVMGNYSKFVRPGFVRIGATAGPANGVLVSAFKDPSSGKFAIVVINTNGSNTNINFSLSGFSSSSISPWVTSSSLNLVQQPAFSVSGGKFGYSLSGNSVTTFVGTGQ